MSAALLDRLHETSRRLGLEVEALKSCLRTVRVERDAAKVQTALYADRIIDLEKRLDTARDYAARLQSELEAPRG